MPETLRSLGIRPSRKLGQNFLLHPDLARKTVAWAGVRRGDVVLEIGPGLGALTHALILADARVVAVEKDRRLADFLRDRFAGTRDLTVVEGDILDTPIAQLLGESARDVSVVSNLPYSVSTPILEILVRERFRFLKVCLMLQEEFVNRIAAAPGTADYGRLSVWIGTFFEIERGFAVQPAAFHPRPEVGSRLVRLIPLPRAAVGPSEEEAFFSLTSLLFRHRRKTVRSILGRHSGATNPEAALSAARIDPMTRPERLGIGEILALSRELASGL